MVWFFERGPERLELAVRRNQDGYEMVVCQPGGRRTVTFAGPAQALVEHIQAAPHALIAAGWRPRPQFDFPPFEVVD